LFLKIGSDFEFGLEAIGRAENGVACQTEISFWLDEINCSSFRSVARTTKVFEKQGCQTPKQEKCTKWTQMYQMVIKYPKWS
jgi:hypothetical protein